MNDERFLEQRVAAVLAASAPVRAPGTVLDGVLSTTARTRPRPRWLALVAQATISLPSGGAVGSPWIRRAAIVLALLVVVLTAAGLLAVGSLLPRPAPIPAERGVFRSVAPMAFVREVATATLLADGRVLVTGGYPDSPGIYGSPEKVFSPSVQTAEIWDPATESFTRTGDMAHGRWGHAAVRLSDDRVLIVGGYSPGPIQVESDGSSSQSNAPTTAAELWDPATGSFSPAGVLTLALAPLTAWLEPDGRVRVVGVESDPEGPTDGPWIAELWDPETMTFTDAPTPVVADSMPGVTLPDGRRLWVDGLVALAWDPASASLAPFTALLESATKTLLPDGRILVAGGTGGVDVGRVQDATRGCGPAARIWDPATASSSPTGSLGVSRGHHAAALLGDGRVLVVGNYWTCSQPWTAEVFELR